MNLTGKKSGEKQNQVRKCVWGLGFYKNDTIHSTIKKFVSPPGRCDCLLQDAATSEISSCSYSGKSRRVMLWTRNKKQTQTTVLIRPSSVAYLKVWARGNLKRGPLAAVGSPLANIQKKCMVNPDVDDYTQLEITAKYSENAKNKSLLKTKSILKPMYQRNAGLVFTFSFPGRDSHHLTPVSYASGLSWCKALCFDAWKHRLKRKQGGLLPKLSRDSE